MAKERIESIDNSIAFQELQNKPQISALQSKVEMYPGGHFAPSTESHRRPAKTGAPGTYSLNFDDADLGEVAKVILSDILGHNYVLSPKVTGKVTLNTSEPLTKAELLPTLEMVLSMNNAALVKDGKIYHIEPKADALHSATVAGSSTGYQSRVVPIRNVAAQEIADIIKPLVHDKTILNVDSSRNALIVQGTSDEIARIMDLVGTFDIDVLRGRSFALFPLNNVAPDQVIEELESIFAVESGKDGSSEFFRFLPIERMNAVLAITQQSNYLRDIESWIYRLDRANNETSGGVNVYRVQHMDAQELADTLNEIFTGAAPKDKSAKVAAGRKSSTLTNKSDGSDNTQAKSSSSRGSSGSVRKKKKSDSGTGTQGKSGGGGGGSQDNDISIVADTANNSLIITATPLEFAKIMPVIKQLDIMPLQVLIDATIAQVTLKDDLFYGIKWFLTQNGKDVSVGSDFFTNGNAQNVLLKGASAFATGGLTAFYDAGTIKSLLQAQADLNNVKIISAPSIMVLNNQEARINVGDQVPVQTSNLTSAVASGGGGVLSGTGTGLAQANQIQYTDTGVTLEVTPRVNSNGMVILDILQVVSKPIPTTTGVTTSPTINKEEMESTVAVKNGETLALGGLISTDNTANRSGIPFFHELPLIGPLFGNTQLNDDRTELVVLLTPRVVKTNQDARVVTDEFKRKLSNIYYDPTRPRRKYDWWRKRDW